MKNITGKIESTKPISLSKAAKSLSNFLSAPNGASHAVTVYLKRASESFNELDQFHKQLKSKQSDHKHTKNRRHFIKDENFIKTEVNTDVVEEQRVPKFGKKYIKPIKIEMNPVEVEDGMVRNSGYENLVKREKNPDGVQYERVKNEGDSGNKNIDKKGIKIEETLHGGVEGTVGNMEESVRKRDKKKKEKREGLEREDGGSIGADDKRRKERKKRKSEEVGDEKVVDLEEQSGSKKNKRKKRKIEGDEHQ